MGITYDTHRGKIKSKSKSRKKKESPTKPEYIFRFIVSGNYGVGKTSCIIRFINDAFIDENHTFTKEINEKAVTINGTQIQLLCCDTVGQEQFSDMTRSYYRNVHGVFILFDITDRRSFNSLDRWIEEFKFNSNDTAVMILIGSKLDLKAEREVSLDEAKEYAALKKLNYFEISSKTGENVKEAFNELAKLVLHKENFE